MATPILPKVQSQITDSTFYTRAEWYDFFRNLLQYVDENSDSAAEIASILARLDALEDGGGSFTISGPQSIKVLGTPANGVVQLLLDGDSATPGATRYYGTNAAAARGFYSLPAGPVPYLIPAGTSYTVPINSQALFTAPIVIEAGGSLLVDGVLAEVS